ncbi:MAG: hypothetical protein H7Z75_07610 [Ferruginibacter sp.]|nr:hypothetical protein [Cytophagales bacterium]
MALYPFILIKHPADRRNPVLLNHELIHHRQQLELLILPFYAWYLLEYALKRIRYRDHYTAYRNIRFEREAFHQEADLDYLRRRKIWAFLGFARSTRIK